MKCWLMDDKANAERRRKIKLYRASAEGLGCYGCRFSVGAKAVVHGDKGGGRGDPCRARYTESYPNGRAA